MGNAYRSVLALKPTGDAVPANVLAGKTFSNAAGVGKTGIMVNNGAVSITLTDQDPTYIIPEGYHNGSGVVGFSASGGDGADLIVTCSSNFAGATISCTDGTTTYQQICPSTAPFEVVFESIPVGTWTISGTSEGVLFSTQFTVVDFETVLNSIPEGSTVIPTDDIQTWLHCANIWNKAYTTISQVLADASTLQALITSNNAADYMARSTTWTTDVTADSSAMSYIGLDDYCSDTLLADSTWLAAICNSTYFESVLNVKVPTMTSNTTPSGVASGSSINAAEFDYFKAFDNVSNTQWDCTANATVANQYLQYDFNDPVTVNKISLRVYDYVSSSEGYNVDVTLKGSNDGVTFNDITTMSISSSELTTLKTFNISNNVSYSKYRLTYSGYTFKASSGNKYVSCGILQLYGRATT